MENVPGKMGRAKALLTLIERLGAKLPDSLSKEERTGQAMKELDKKLGEDWKKEVTSAGLELPGQSSSQSTAMDKKNKVACLYKKIKALMDEHNESPSSIDDGRQPLEEEEDEDSDSVKVIILG